MELLVKIFVSLLCVPPAVVIGVAAAKFTIEPRKPTRRRPF